MLVLLDHLQCSGIENTISHYLICHAPRSAIAENENSSKVCADYFWLEKYCPPTCNFFHDSALLEELGADCIFGQIVEQFLFKIHGRGVYGILQPLRVL
jgi:hypothetical protein